MRTTPVPGIPGSSLVLLLVAFCFSFHSARSEPVVARLSESSFHGFLLVRNPGGTVIGSGEYFQVPRKGHMSVRLVLHFKDGSLDDETTEYAQDHTFRLISDRHIQQGPFFSHPIDTSIDMASQQVKAVPLDKGPDAASAEHMDLPPDLANGIVLKLIANLRKDNKDAKVSYVAFSPKARVVKLAISNAGRQTFKIGGQAFAANRYTIKVELGGIAGIVAPIIGKQPSDIEVWESTGSIPTILRVDGELAADGPIVSLQPASPSW